MNTSLKNFFGVVGEAVRRWLGGLASNHIKKLDRLLVVAGEPGEVKGVEFFGIQIV
ncbi:MAG: hypothetical protein ACREIC_17330 [Limisphaerales bacterium]